jgi:AcrR family transcriptional regulator
LTVEEPSIVQAGLAQVEGLRERKKRETRQMISDTATAMFLDRGFDAVKVTEIAAACGVSEKTVYNYFPSKESLMLDREEATAEAIRTGLGRDAKYLSPIDGAVDILEQDLAAMKDVWNSMEDPNAGMALLRRFADVIEETPSLLAAQRDMIDRLARVAAETMAERAGLSPDDPEPQIAAEALMGLWRVQHTAINRYAQQGLSVDEHFERTMEDVHRAARLIDSGLWTFGAMMDGVDNREQLKAAAITAQRAGRQVISALQQAHRAWHQMKHDDQSNHSQMKDEMLRLKREQHKRSHEFRTESRDRAARMRKLAWEMSRQRRQN